MMKKYLFFLPFLFLGCVKEEPIATSVVQLANNPEVVGWNDQNKHEKIIVKEKVIYKEKPIPVTVTKVIKEPLIDSDKDGVVDKLDKCPNTPSNLIVNHDGCPIIKRLRFNYDFDEYRLKNVYLKEIKQISLILKNNPHLKIEIDGYTDDIGDEKYNKILSFKRAEEIRGILMRLGIDGDRIIAKGFGEKYPLFPNTNSTNRALNRRVEIVQILNK